MFFEKSQRKSRVLSFSKSNRMTQTKAYRVTVSQFVKTQVKNQPISIII